MGGLVGAEGVAFSGEGGCDDFLYGLFPRRRLLAAQYGAKDGSLDRGCVGFDDLFCLRVLGERRFEFERHVGIFGNPVVVGRFGFAQSVVTQAFRAHLPFFGEPLSVAERIVAPLALIGATREIAHEGVFVESLDRRIYPAEADSFFNDFAMRGKRLSGVLLVDDDTDFVLLLVVLAQPLAELFGTEDGYLLHDIKSIAVFCKILE